MTILITWLKKHHIIHSWGRWQEKLYSISYFNVNPPFTGNKLFQDRQCSVCGKKESCIV